MKTSNYPVDQVYSLLHNGGYPTVIYKDCKPTEKNDAEYIVINSLPLSSGVYQRTFINVNCHVKDKAEGIPNRTKLDLNSAIVLSILEKVSTTTMLMDFESSELIREENLGEHYFNLRFKVTIINR